MSIDFKIMLDSGAFSAWTKEASIDIVDYMDFIDHNHEHLDCYFNLDVIPGRPRQKVRAHDKEMAARASWLNYKSMKRAGYSPVPVFHFGEDVKWLKKILDDGPALMSLGGLVRQPRPLLQQWLDMVFAEICDGQGIPRIPVHGLGLTSLPLMLRYPWASVDSVSWILHSAFGFVYLAHKGYDKPPIKMHVSKRAEGEKAGASVKAGKAFESLGKTVQAALIDKVQDAGVSWDAVRTTPYARAVLNSEYYITLSRRHVVKPYRPACSKLFASPVKASRKTLSPMDVIFGVSKRTAVADGYTDALDLHGEGRRMISYHYWAGSTEGLEKYRSLTVERHQELKEHRESLQEQGRAYVPLLSDGGLDEQELALEGPDD